MEKLYPHCNSCTKCLLPETQETITYDAEGVCNVCKQVEYKKEKIDWDSREKDFLKLLEEYKGKNDYDCIVPFSGGKDSTFTLYTLVVKYGLKPLVVSFDHGFFRPKTNANVDKILKRLGVDYIKFKPNWKVVKKLMLESLRRKGDFCWHCHTGVFAYPMHIAINFKIPLVIWGEPSSEYTAYYSYEDKEEVDEKRFNRYVNLGITAEDMVGMIDGVTMRDLKPFSYPPLKELKKMNYRSICLGTYVPWDPKKNSKMLAEELGWEGDEVEGIPPEYNYEKVECMLTGIRDFLKYIKRGFGRTAHLMSLDLRNGRITQEEAIEKIKKYDGKRPASLDYFLEVLELSEDEFYEIALSHVISPNVPIEPRELEAGKRVWDQDQWDKTKID